LQLFVTLPDVARFDDSSVAQWQLIDAAGHVSRRGSGTPEQIPRIEPLVALLPASRVVFIQTPLPAANMAPQKRDQLVRYAIEDKLTIDPATVHAVVMDASRSRSTTHIVSAVDRVWFAAALAWLQRAGLTPRAVHAETALLPVAPGEWSVQLGERNFARRDDGFAYALDASTDHAPPFSLVLALGEAAQKPKSMALYAAKPVDPVLVEKWQSQLGVTVRAAASGAGLSGASALSKSGNFLTGDFAPAQPARMWLTLAKPALILCGCIVLAHVAFTTLDWWQLRKQRNALQRDLTATFRETFPQAVAVVDAPLQMRRNLDQLKRERGMVREDDPRRGLAQLAGLAAGSRDLDVTRVVLKDGLATMTLKASGKTGAPDDSATANLQERLATLPGAQLAAGKTSGTIEVTLKATP
jgi:general secretion pathway protein L